MKRWLGVVVLLAAGVLAWVVLGRRRQGGAAPLQVADRTVAPAPVAAAASAPAVAPRAAPEPAGPPVSVAAPAAASEPFGPGSAAPLPDGSVPEGFAIKGNENSMLYHPSDSPYYGRTKAEVWFRDEESARSAGFQRWDHKRRA